MKKSVWLPALIAPVVVAGAVAAPVIAQAASTPIAGDDPTAAAVIASIAKSSDAQYSGKLAQTSDLGLPELPAGAGGSSLEGDASDAFSLLTASHTARVYVDGPSKQRVQVTEQLAEQDLIRNGSTVWTWDSKERAATKTTLPSRAAESPRQRHGHSVGRRRAGHRRDHADHDRLEARRDHGRGARCLVAHPHSEVLGHPGRFGAARGRPADRAPAPRDRHGHRRGRPGVPGRVHQSRVRSTGSAAVRLHPADGCRRRFEGPVRRPPGLGRAPPRV
ncbi:hypothetical protein [Curtobacterium sp. MCPF17_052]|uniref:hypothetical protein n=1 Tax=Curtobacterium sp. MCPF17_052 TaxID=2175655 RepID=UPI0024DF7167|nr:hypothetical protein [Curtobacterium sp. MCPF17_052]WIB13204.1 hypothetical protein DEJ36_04790 [Curtobacterium sp. MCPF17_052]